MSKKDALEPEIFPQSKIKAQLQRNQDVGKLSNQAVQFISVCSSMFLRQLCQDALEAREDSDAPLTLDHVKTAAKKHAFLHLDDISDDEQIQPQPRKRKKKAAASKSKAAAAVLSKNEVLGDPTTAIQAAVQEAEQSKQPGVAATGTSTGQIIVDEDDYD